jgi:epoxyqueuosine reductase
MGLSQVGVTHTGPSEHLPFYRDWLEAGHHGDMGYLAREDAVERRGNLQLTLPEALTAVVVTQGYDRPDPEGVPDDPSRGVIARYARGRDYHMVLMDRLEDLARWISREGAARGLVPVDEDGEPLLRWRAYVDTGPVLEREMARRAGLGWFGRNTMLIDPRRGSYFFLGVLLIDLELPAEFPFFVDRCGTCTRCIDACPTDALLGRDESGAPVLDARRCISYLTIEQKGVIDPVLRGAMGNRVFGCDICQEVCPWNQRFSPISEEPEYRARPGTDGPDLVEWAQALLEMSEKEYQRRYGDSPLARPRRKGMLRNVMVALGNWLRSDPQGAARAVPVLESALQDPQELVREHAEWALEARQPDIG